MSEKDEGGYFNPLAESENWLGHEGITRRNWLAGLAMQSLLIGIRDNTTLSKARNDVKDIPAAAYKMADALIAEGNK